ncbi:MAG: TonB-dependent receptor plug domain-containing protein [Planctomycetota bacterium]|jgi:outer membrane receptor for ferrienterochelin and colicins
MRRPTTDSASHADAGRRGAGRLAEICLAVQAVLAFPALAEDDLPGPRDELPEIVVTASRVEQPAREEPVSVHVVRSEELENAGTRTVGDALRWVPGVDVSGGAPFGAASRSTVLFQGLPAQYSLVMIDGQRTKSDHIHTGVNLELIPVSMIERIEVVRGPGSVVNGSDALGGIVNVVTKPVPEGSRSALAATYGSENTVDLALFHGMTRGAFGYAVMADASTSDGMVPGAEYDKGSGRAKIHASPSDTLALKGDVAYYEGDYATSEDSMAQCRFDLQAGSGDSGRAKLGVDFTDYDRVFKSGAATADNDVVSSVLQYDRAFAGRHRMVAGVEWRNEEFERLATSRHDADIVSAYVQDAVGVGDSAKVMLGLRTDSYDVTGTEVSPRGAVHWFGDGYDVHLSVAKGLRIPSLQDLYEYRYNHTTYLRDGNPDLEPETSIHFSIEGRHALPVGSVEATWFVFRNDIDNMIALQDTGVDDGGLDVFQRYNIREAHTQGIEVGAADKSGPLGGIEWRASYALLDAKDDTTGDELAYNPKHTLKAGLKYRRGRFSVGALVESAMDRCYRDKSGVVGPLDDYFLVDLNFDARLSAKASLSLSIRNVFDEEFEVYEEGKALASYGRFVALSVRSEF